MGSMSDMTAFNRFSEQATREFEDLVKAGITNVEVDVSYSQVMLTITVNSPGSPNGQFTEYVCIPTDPDTDDEYDEEEEDGS